MEEMMLYVIELKKENTLLRNERVKKEKMRFIFKTYFLLLLIIFFSVGCKKENFCPCGLGFKKQKFTTVDLPIPSPNNEKYIIQTEADYQSVFQQNVLDGFVLPSIDFNNKTLLGGYVDYVNEENFDSKLFLCLKKRKKSHVYKIYARKTGDYRMYYPRMYWILSDKISSDNSIKIEIIKK